MPRNTLPSDDTALPPILARLEEPLFGSRHYYYRDGILASTEDALSSLEGLLEALDVAHDFWGPRLSNALCAGKSDKHKSLILIALDNEYQQSLKWRGQWFGNILENLSEKGIRFNGQAYEQRAISLVLNGQAYEQRAISLVLQERASLTDLRTLAHEAAHEYGHLLNGLGINPAVSSYDLRRDFEGDLARYLERPNFQSSDHNYISRINAFLNHPFYNLKAKLKRISSNPKFWQLTAKARDKRITEVIDLYVSEVFAHTIEQEVVKPGLLARHFPRYNHALSKTVFDATSRELSIEGGTMRGCASQTTYAVQVNERRSAPRKLYALNGHGSQRELSHLHAPSSWDARFRQGMDRQNDITPLLRAVESRTGAVTTPRRLTFKGDVPVLYPDEIIDTRHWNGRRGTSIGKKVPPYQKPNRPILGNYSAGILSTGLTAWSFKKLVEADREAFPSSSEFGHRGAALGHIGFSYGVGYASTAAINSAIGSAALGCAVTGGILPVVETMAVCAPVINDMPVDAKRNDRAFFEASLLIDDISQGAMEFAMDAWDRGEAWTREYNVNSVRALKSVNPPFLLYHKAKEAIIDEVRREFNDLHDLFQKRNGDVVATGEPSLLQQFTLAHFGSKPRKKSNSKSASVNPSVPSAPVLSAGFIPSFQTKSIADMPIMTDSIPDRSVDLAKASIDPDISEHIAGLFDKDGILDTLRSLIASADDQQRPMLNSLLVGVEKNLAESLAVTEAALAAVTKEPEAGDEISDKKAAIDAATIMVLETVGQIFRDHLEARQRKTALDRQIKSINQQVAHLDIQFTSAQLHHLVDQSPAVTLQERVQTVLQTTVAGSLTQQIDLQREVIRSFDTANQRYERYRQHGKAVEIHQADFKKHMKGIADRLERLNKSHGLQQFCSDLATVSITVATCTKNPCAVAVAVAISSVSALWTHSKQKKVGQLNDRFEMLQQAATLNNSTYNETQQLTTQYLSAGNQAIAFMIQNRHLMSPDSLYEYMQRQRRVLAEQQGDLSKAFDKANRDLTDKELNVLYLSNKVKRKTGEMTEASSAYTAALVSKDKAEDALEDNREQQARLGMDAIAHDLYSPALQAMHGFKASQLPKETRYEDTLYESKTSDVDYTDDELAELKRREDDVREKKRELTEALQAGEEHSFEDLTDKRKDLAHAQRQLQDYRQARPYIGYTQADWSGDIMACFKEAFETESDRETAKAAFIKAYIAKQNEQGNKGITEEEAGEIFDAHVHRVGVNMVLESFNDTVRELNSHYATQDQLVYTGLGALSNLNRQLQMTGWIDTTALKKVDRALGLGSAGYDLYVIGRSTYHIVRAMSGALTEAKEVSEKATDALISGLMGNMIGVGINVISALGSTLQIYNLCMDNQPDMSAEIRQVIQEIRELKDEMQRGFKAMQSQIAGLKTDVRYLRHQLDYAVSILESQDHIRISDHTDSQSDRSQIEKLERATRKLCPTLTSKPAKIRAQLTQLIKKSTDPDVTGANGSIVNTKGDLRPWLSANPWLSIDALRQSLGMKADEKNPLANIQYLNHVMQQLSLLPSEDKRDIQRSLRPYVNRLDAFCDDVADVSNWKDLVETRMKAYLATIQADYRKLRQQSIASVRENVESIASTHKSYDTSLSNLLKAFPKEKNHVYGHIWEDSIQQIQKESGKAASTAPLLHRKRFLSGKKIRTASLQIDNGVVIEPIQRCIDAGMLPLIFPHAYLQNLIKDHEGLQSLLKHESEGLLSLKFEYLVAERQGEKELNILAFYVLSDSKEYKPYAMYPVFKFNSSRVKADLSPGAWDYYCLSKILYGDFRWFMDYNLPRYVEKTRSTAIYSDTPSQVGHGWTKSDFVDLVEVYKQANGKPMRDIIDVQLSTSIYAYGSLKHVVATPAYLFWGIFRAPFALSGYGDKAYLHRIGLFAALEDKAQARHLITTNVSTECDFITGQDDPCLHSTNGTVNIRAPLPKAHIKINSAAVSDDQLVSEHVYTDPENIIEQSGYALRRDVHRSLNKGDMATALEGYKTQYETLIHALRFQYDMSYEQACDHLERASNCYHPVKVNEMMRLKPELLESYHEHFNLSITVTGVAPSETILAIKRLSLALEHEPGVITIPNLVIVAESDAIEDTCAQLAKNARFEFTYGLQDLTAAGISWYMNAYLKELAKAAESAKPVGAKETVDEAAIAASAAAALPKELPASQHCRASFFTMDLTSIGQFNRSFRYVPISGDGHCMFASISHHTGTPVKTLRQQVSDHMLRHRQAYSRFWSKTVGEYTQFANKIAKMQAQPEWGEAICLRILHELTERPIYVFSELADVPVFRLESHQKEGAEAIFLLYQQRPFQEHYNTLDVNSDSNNAMSQDELIAFIDKMNGFVYYDSKRQLFQTGNARCFPLVNAGRVST